MTGSTRKGPGNRWLAGGLVLSLALNAFVIGAVATDLLRVKWGSGDREARALRFEMRWLEGRLDPEALRQVDAGVAVARPKAIAHIERLGELRNELAALAAVAAPDRAAIDAQLAAIRTEVEAMQAEVQGATMDALLALPPETRARLAEAPAAP